MAKPERNTLLVDFADVEKYNPRLKEAILDQCYRLYPYLCNAVKNFVKENQTTQIPASNEGSNSTQSMNDQSQSTQIPANKDFYVAFHNVSHSYKSVFLRIDFCPNVAYWQCKSAFGRSQSKRIVDNENWHSNAYYGPGDTHTSRTPGTRQRQFHLLGLSDGCQECATAVQIHPGNWVFLWLKTLFFC